MTVIEWLLDNLISEPHFEKDFEHNSKCWEKALEFEIEQLEQAYFDGTNFEINGFGNDSIRYVKQLKNKL